ncbi:hypothetical protein [Lacrimispora sp.]|nr:hypothetical protein [Lacrimispora sp.]
MLKRIDALKHDNEGAERILSIEDALTRVQSNRQKALIPYTGMDMMMLI